MPKHHFMSVELKLHAASLIDSAKQSIRRVADIIGVPKSTLHDNLDHYRDELKNYEQWCDRSEQNLVRSILLMSLDGISSSRGCATVLSKLTGQDISHQKVLSVLETTSEVARKKNDERLSMKIAREDGELSLAPLTNVHCAAFDEIFQKKEPILGFIDPVSSFLYLEKAHDRSGDSWTNFLKKLLGLGLNPDSTNTDGGQGLCKAIGCVFPNAIQHRDLFHVLQKLSRALKALEGNCYRLIANYDRAIKNMIDNDESGRLKAKMDRTIDLFDHLELLTEKFRKACYFENEREYVSSQGVENILNEIIASFDACLDDIKIKHRAIKEARSYLKGAKSNIVAYKSIIEKMVTSKFGAIYANLVLGYICPIIEYLDQINRSYENQARKHFWTKKLVEARRQFRSLSFVDQEEVDAAINSVASIMSQSRKSNSLIEAVNSVIRRHLSTYKSIPSWFCPLFTFYWNHRTFKRGKRKNLKPREIITGKAYDGDWVDALLDDYPFKKEGSGKCLPARLTKAA